MAAPRTSTHSRSRCRRCSSAVPLRETLRARGRATVHAGPSALGDHEGRRLRSGVREAQMPPADAEQCGAPRGGSAQREPNLALLAAADLDLQEAETFGPTG